MKKHFLPSILTFVVLWSYLVLPANAAGEAEYRYILQGIIDEIQEIYAQFGSYPNEYPSGGGGALYDLNGDGSQELIVLYWGHDEIMEGGSALYAKLFTLSPSSGIPALLINERLCGNAGAADGFAGVMRKDGRLYFCTSSAEGDNEYYVEACKLYSLNGLSVSLVDQAVAKYTDGVPSSCTLNNKIVSEQEYISWMSTAEEVMVLQGYSNPGTPLSSLLAQVESLSSTSQPPSSSNRPATAGMDNFSPSYSYYDGLFWDVGQNDWFEENVACAYELGLMNGMGGGSFAPHSEVTLAQAITLAARIHSIYYTGSDNFAPSPSGSWYTPYVIYANQNDIPCNFYDLNRPATREQFVYILSAALPKSALPAIPTNQWAIDFSDYNYCAYTDAIDLMTRAGIIQGMQDGYGGLQFDPSSTINRASVSAIVTRMAKFDLRIR